VTGDGRLVRSGARTVKNVTGYDLHKLVAGSLGTLAVIVQVALKLRPLPRARRTLRFDGDLELADQFVGAVHGSAAVLATPGAVDVRLEGWSEEIEEQTTMARRLVQAVSAEDDAPFPPGRPWEGFRVVVEAAVPPSRLGGALTGDAWGALAGVGIAWVGVDANREVVELRNRVRAVGGVAPVVRGPGGLGPSPIPAPGVQRRLKQAFDPNEVLAPGRFWSRAEY
jgi:glycolate oxidase FAD binding subunit